MCEPEAVTILPEIGKLQLEHETVGAPGTPDLSHGRRLFDVILAGDVEACFGRGLGAVLELVDPSSGAATLTVGPERLIAGGENAIDGASPEST